MTVLDLSHGKLSFSPFEEQSFGFGGNLSEAELRIVLLPEHFGLMVWAVAGVDNG